MSIGSTKPPVSAPTTSMGENSRAGSVGAQQTDQPHTGGGWLRAKIKKIASPRKVVQLSDPATGTVLFGGKYATLLHTVNNISSDFGQIRVGMEVLAWYQGKVGAPTAVYALVFGLEMEGGPSADFAANFSAMGFHNILMENL